MFKRIISSLLVIVTILTTIVSNVNAVTTDNKASTVSETYTITFDATLGSNAPAPQIKTHGVALTLPDEIPVGNESIVFSFWSTSELEYDVTFKPGDEFNIEADTTLYAVWSLKTYSIVYHADDCENVPQKQTKYYSSKINLSSQIPTRDGYEFLGWDTSPDASKVVYKAGATYTNNENLDLYAVWNKTSVTVSYDANGGVNAPEKQIKFKEIDLILSETIPTRDGYTFLGWDTSFTGTNVIYNPGDAYSVHTDITLYAVWKANTYSVTYSTKGGTNAPGSQEKKHDVDLVLSDTIPVKSGYKFLGWDTSSDATNVVYNPGDVYDNNSDVTLYAVWEKDVDSVYHVTVDGNEYHYVIGQTVTIKTSQVMMNNEGQYVVFGEWVIEGVEIVDTTATAISFIMPANDVTISRKSSYVLGNADCDTENKVTGLDILELTTRIKNDDFSVYCDLDFNGKVNGTDTIILSQIIKGTYEFDCWLKVN